MHIIINPQYMTLWLIIWEKFNFGNIKFANFLVPLRSLPDNLHVYYNIMMDNSRDNNATYFLDLVIQCKFYMMLG